MRQSLTGWLLLMLTVVAFSGCAAASGIFKGGMAVASSSAPSSSS